MLILAALSIILVSCSRKSDDPPSSTTEPGSRTAASPTPSSTATTNTDRPDSPPDSSDPTPKPDPEKASNTNVETSPTPTATLEIIEPLIVGYDLEFQEGDFWRFRWEWTDRSCSQGSACKNTEDGGVFQIFLGTPTVSNGVTMFELMSVGDSDYVDGNTTHSFAPEWRYIGVDENRIVVSKTQSSKLVVLFDAQSGRWPGSSFFSGRFSD